MRWSSPGSVASTTARSSYSLSFADRHLGQTDRVSRLAATRAEEAARSASSTGSPIHSASLQVVWAHTERCRERDGLRQPRNEREVRRARVVLATLPGELPAHARSTCARTGAICRCSTTSASRPNGRRSSSAWSLAGSKGLAPQALPAQARSRHADLGRLQDHNLPSQADLRVADPCHETLPCLVPRRSPRTCLEALECLQSQDFDFALCWAGSAPPAVPGAIFVHAGDGPRWPRAGAGPRGARSARRALPLRLHARRQRAVHAARHRAPVRDLRAPRAGPRPAAFTPASRCAQTIALQHSEFQVRFHELHRCSGTGVLARDAGPGDADARGRARRRLVRPGLAAADAPGPRRVVDANAGGRVGAAHRVAPVARRRPRRSPRSATSSIRRIDAAIKSRRPASDQATRCGSASAPPTSYALLEALMRSCRGLGLDASHFTRLPRAPPRLRRHRRATGGERPRRRSVSPRTRTGRRRDEVQPCRRPVPRCRCGGAVARTARREPAADTSQAAATPRRRSNS